MQPEKHSMNISGQKNKPIMNWYFYANSIANFAGSTKNEILNALVAENSFDLAERMWPKTDSVLVQGYALDFKNFHEVSRDLVIAPVLIANEAPDSSATQEFCLYDDKVVYRNLNGGRWETRTPDIHGVNVTL